MNWKLLSFLASSYFWGPNAMKPEPSNMPYFNDILYFSGIFNLDIFDLLYPNFNIRLLTDSSSNTL